MPRQVAGTRGDTGIQGNKGNQLEVAACKATSRLT
jgi:hypothetical protein